MFWGLFVAVAQKPLQRSQERQQRGLVGVKDAARFLPVAAVAFVALLVSDLLRTKPIYGELLERYVRAQGMQMAIASHVGSGIMELPLEMGAIADGKRVRDVRWPSGCLIIGLRRGESEIVPRGDTRLRAGDYLVVLFSGEEEREVRPAMRRLCDARLD